VRGRNELLVNEATMMDAFQMYLSSIMRAPVPKVVGIKKSDDTYIVSIDSVAVETNNQE